MATSSFTENLVIKDRKVAEKLLRAILAGPKEPLCPRKSKYTSVSQEAIKNARKWKL